MSLLQWMKQLVRPAGDAVLYRSIHQNIYHCTVQKCASQWVRRLLSDPRVHRHSALSSYQYQQQLPGKYDPRKLTERRFTTAFPEATIATPIYVDFEGYATIPKPARYRTIFVMRDPRDVLVSWYFSGKFSHPVHGEIDRIRQDLNRLPQSDGLLYALDHLANYGLFQAQRSWADASAKDANVLLLRYEDLFGPEQSSIVERLLIHCDIRLPREDMEDLLAAHRFEQLSGRAPGQEDVQSHYRKGVAGDWRNYFGEAMTARFMEIGGDLLQQWNYEVT